MPTDRYLNKIVLNKMTREQFDNLAVKNPDEFYAITDNTKTSGFDFFDVIEKDHILTYEESKGLALLGSYVYKEAVAGSRYGYPDFYNKVVAEKEAGVATETQLGSNTVTMYVNSNGHIFYDIADKDAVDVFYNTYGVAWYYGVDTENERVFLPRNDWFTQGCSESDVGKFVDAGLPDHYHLISRDTDITHETTGSGGSPDTVNNYSGTNTYSTSKASVSNPIYGNSDTVQPKAVKKLFYMCVGNTTSYEGITEVVNQGMEILEQVNEAINNVVPNNRELIASYGNPDYSAMVTTSTAPVDGYFIVNTMVLQPNTNVIFSINGVGIADIDWVTSNTANRNGGWMFKCSKGDVFSYTKNSGTLSSITVNFVPLKGAN